MAGAPRPCVPQFPQVVRVRRRSRKARRGGHVTRSPAKLGRVRALRRFAGAGRGGRAPQSVLIPTSCLLRLCPRACCSAHCRNDPPFVRRRPRPRRHSPEMVPWGPTFGACARARDRGRRPRRGDRSQGRSASARPSGRPRRSPAAARGPSGGTRDDETSHDTRHRFTGCSTRWAYSLTSRRGVPLQACAARGHEYTMDVARTRRIWHFEVEQCATP